MVGAFARHIGKSPDLLDWEAVRGLHAALVESPVVRHTAGANAGILAHLQARRVSVSPITKSVPPMTASPQLENPIAWPCHAPKSPTRTHSSKGTQKKQLMHGVLSDPTYFCPHISLAPA